MTSSSPEPPTRTAGAHRAQRARAQREARDRTVAQRPPTRYEPYLDGLFTVKVYVDHQREPAGHWTARVAIAPAAALVSVKGYGTASSPSDPGHGPDPYPSDPHPTDPTGPSDPTGPGTPSSSSGPDPTPTASDPAGPAPGDPPPASSGPSSSGPSDLSDPSDAQGPTSPPGGSGEAGQPAS